MTLKTPMYMMQERLKKFLLKYGEACENMHENSPSRGGMKHTNSGKVKTAEEFLDEALKRFKEKKIGSLLDLAYDKFDESVESAWTHAIILNMILKYIYILSEEERIAKKKENNETPNKKETT